MYPDSQNLPGPAQQTQSTSAAVELTNAEERTETNSRRVPEAYSVISVIVCYPRRFPQTSRLHRELPSVPNLDGVPVSVIHSETEDLLL